MHHMRAGEWEAAWKISDREMLRRTRQTQHHLPRHLQQIWDGRSLRSKRVLVRCYHGLGDTVQFVRFMPQLKQVAREVTVWCQSPLIPLLQTARGIDRLLPLHDGIPEIQYDVDIELMEVPHALRTNLRTLPRHVPYFDLQPSRRREPSPGPLRAGIVWQSGGWDSRRSIAPGLMRTLMQSCSCVRWSILQRGPALASWRCDDRLAEVPRLTGILDEAAELSCLDLLISVDTLSAHLAGALGVRTWTLLPFESDWRWMDQRADSPWYPTMRLFRQHRSGDWQGVIENVRSSLQQLVSAHAVTGQVVPLTPVKV
jgi:hypothetical protein